jgi:hypothetical protein
MLNICGSNLIPIFITFLCCGAIFIYFNLRLTDLKISVEKQNRVLTSFITNVQQDIRTGGMSVTSLAAPEALVAAKKFEEENNNINEKIVVSDDEDEEDDDDDSETSDSESDTDDEADELDEPEPEVKTIKIINVAELNEERMIPISFEMLSGIVIEPINDITNDAIHNSANESSITEIIDEPLSLDDTSAYEQMKVDELRKIATDKNLATKDEIKKLKKPELLLLLKK